MPVSAAGGVPTQGPPAQSSPIRLAVLGDPLLYTRSPDLHRAGLDALGIAGDSEAIRTAPERLGERLAELAARGLRGVNLTRPLKEAALAHLPRVSDAARAARSVNTVGLDRDGWWGDTTDGPGLMDLLAELDRGRAAERVVMLGAGGAARSLARSLIEAGGSIVASARRPSDAEPSWGDLPRARVVGWRSPDEEAALAEATMVVNATPLSGRDEPAPLVRIAKDALVLDLNYGAEVTPWTLEARAEGRAACDGLGLLVHQARRSLGLWFGRTPPLEPLARAVGWPR